MSGVVLMPRQNDRDHLGDVRNYRIETSDDGEQWREVSPEAAKSWEKAIECLLGLDMAERRGDPKDLQPRYVRLSGSGRSAWVRFTEAHAKELNAEDFPDHLRGP